MSADGSIIGILWFLLMIGLSICYYRHYRRKQAEAQFLRRVQMVAAQVQPQIIYQIHPISVPLLQESAPPSYEQIVSVKQNEQNTNKMNYQFSII